MKQSTWEAEYAIQMVNVNHWKAHKFCGHHGSYLGNYDIKIMALDGKIEFVCTCQAGRNCKHIRMVAETLTPKKDLF